MSTNGKLSGTIKFFDTRKGFGFIKPDDGSRDVFISLNNVPKDSQLLPDTRVTYQLGEDKKGKGPFAIDLAIG